MGINNKPFNSAEKVRLLSFGGYPMVLNNQDLNKQFSVIDDVLQRLSTLVGMIRQNWNASLSYTIDTSTIPGSTIYTYTITFTVTGEAGYIYYNGVRFVLPYTNDQTITGSVTVPNYQTITGFVTEPQLTYVLTAQLNSDTFTTNPALCGINSTEYPTKVPSCNALDYSNEVVQLSTASLPSNISPGVSTLIGNLFSIVPVRVGGDIKLQLLYHAILPNDILTGNSDNSILNGTGIANSDITTYPFNGSILEMINLLQIYVDNAITEIDTAALQLEITALQEQVNTLITTWLTTEQSWTNVVAFGYHWGNVGGGNIVARYKHDLFNFVHLDGLVTRDNVSTLQPIFNLPAGWRPAALMTYNSILVKVSDGSFIPALVTITSGGDVNVQTFGGSYTGTISLSGIVFKAEN